MVDQRNNSKKKQSSNNGSTVRIGSVMKESKVPSLQNHSCGDQINGNFRKKPGSLINGTMVTFAKKTESLLNGSTKIDHNFKKEKI